MKYKIYEEFFEKFFIHNVVFLILENIKNIFKNTAFLTKNLISRKINEILIIRDI